MLPLWTRTGRSLSLSEWSRFVTVDVTFQSKNAKSSVLLHDEKGVKLSQSKLSSRALVLVTTPKNFIWRSRAFSIEPHVDRIAPFCWQVKAC